MHTALPLEAWYGLSRGQFMQMLKVFTGIGVFAVVLVLVVVLVKGMPVRQPAALLWVLPGIPCIWLVLGSVLSITSLRVGAQEVHWYLFRRFLVRSYPVASLRCIEPGTFSAVRIRTDRGTIHLLGLYVDDRLRLAQHLLVLNPRLRSDL